MSQELIPLYQDDTLEDLQRGGFRMLQKKNGFRFGLDSVLLAASAAEFYEKTGGRSLKAADLGAGCGAVSLLLAARLPGLSIIGLELDRLSCATMVRNIRLNGLENRVQAAQGDICQLAAGKLPDIRLASGSFDLVVSNPPYQRHATPILAGGATGGEDATAGGANSRRQARAETALSLEQLIGAAAKLLRPGGRLVMVHQVRRLPEIIVALKDSHLEPKNMRLIQSLPSRAPITFILSAVRQGKPGGFIAAPPIIVCRSPGVWSDETAALYGLEPAMPESELYRGLRMVDEYENTNQNGGDGGTNHD